MKLKKPAYIAENPIMSEKWDEITKNPHLEEKHITAIEQLCFWYAVLRKCQEDITENGDIQVAYINKIDDIKAMPQMSSVKQASAEIRALNKQLGLLAEIEEERVEKKKEKNDTPLTVIRGRRQRKANAANS